jgi:thiamine transport system substrate-binding protein
MRILPVVMCLLLLAACAPPPAPGPANPSDQPQRLVLMSHDSFAVSEAVIRQFEAEYNATVEFLKAGDAGEALNKACLSKANPLADLFFGVDNTFFSRAIACDIFEPYASPALADIPRLAARPAEPAAAGGLRLRQSELRPQLVRAAGPVCAADAARPDAAGVQSLLVAPNPATSSPGLAFLLATVAAFGERATTPTWTSGAICGPTTCW